MKTHPTQRVWFLSLVLTVVLSAAATAAGQQPGTEPEEGFIHLFNGKDLEGWDGDPRLWSVVDGVIRGETTSENPAHGNTFCIWRGGKLENFVLKLKFRIQNGNSGVQYRSDETDTWRIRGYQAEVENNPGKVGFLYDEARRGWLVDVGDFMVVERDASDQVQKNVVSKVADVEALKQADYYKMKDWNEYTIIARGNHLIHYLNGYQTIEMIDNDPKGRALEGLLALQIHAGPPMVVEFKDIRLKQLTAGYGEAIRLFNGENLEGWTPSSDSQQEVWTVKDGLLCCSGSPVGYLRTQDDYTNYVLRMQLRHLKPGNGGVLLRMVGEDKVWPRSVEAQGASGSMGDIFTIDQFPLQAPPERTQGRHTRKAHPSNEKPVGQWNEYEIVLDADHLKIKVNGLVQNEATGCLETAGKICLQSEGTPMEFRNIVLIPIVQ